MVSIWEPRREKVCRVFPRGPQSASRSPPEALGLPERALSPSTPLYPLSFQEAWETDFLRGGKRAKQRPLLELGGPAGAERRLRAQFGEAGGGSEAEAEFLAHAAAVALHHTAPVEAAQAVLLELHALLAVPTAATQQVAAAEVGGTAVAGAAARAR